MKYIGGLGDNNEVYLKTDRCEVMNWIRLAHEPLGSAEGEELGEQLPVSQEAPRSMEFLEVVTKPYMRVSKCDDTIMFMQVDWRNIVQRIHCPTQHHIMKNQLYLDIVHTLELEHTVYCYGSRWIGRGSLYTGGHPFHLTCHLLNVCVFVETLERVCMSRKITDTG